MSFLVMSDDLSKVVDKFFVSTGIQNHNYGIPSIKNASLSSQRDIFPKELKYTNSYQELTTKLNRLIYLNEMKQFDLVEAFHLSKLVKET